MASICSSWDRSHFLYVVAAKRKFRKFDLLISALTAVKLNNLRERGSGRIEILPGNPHLAFPCLPCLPCLRAGTGRPGGEGISARHGGLIEAGGQPGRLTYGRGFRRRREIRV